MTPWLGGAFSASLLICACGVGDEPPVPATEDISAAAAAADPGIAASEEAPAAKIPAEETAAAEPPPEASAAGKPAAGGEIAPRLAMRPVKELAPPDPGRLLGMGQEEVAGLLGPPVFERRDDPALVWQYRSAACILDVFLYRDGAVYSVAHFEVRGPSVVEVDRKACFLGLIRDRAKPG